MTCVQEKDTSSLKNAKVQFALKKREHAPRKLFCKLILGIYDFSDFQDKLLLSSEI